mmetsp:Transcript_11272/g.20263  ORF Transcript_11272/g.20263 Transcript_11272/m.20263 type:complete len:103 (+) Transcript_11272:226-534(+)
MWALVGSTLESFRVVVPSEGDLGSALSCCKEIIWRDFPFIQMKKSTPVRKVGSVCEKRLDYEGGHQRSKQEARRLHLFEDHNEQCVLQNSAPKFMDGGEELT